MHTELARIRSTLHAALAELDRIEASLPTRSMPKHLDCVSPGIPAGYATILGYLASYHPDILDTLEDYSAPDATQRDGFWASHRTREAGMRSFLVTAPACLQRRGIFTVNAYPVQVLARRWG